MLQNSLHTVTGKDFTKLQKRSIDATGVHFKDWWCRILSGYGIHDPDKRELNRIWVWYLCEKVNCQITLFFCPRWELENKRKREKSQKCVNHNQKWENNFLLYGEIGYPLTALFTRVVKIFFQFRYMENLAFSKIYHTYIIFRNKK